jgi:hypothetical protein
MFPGSVSMFRERESVFRPKKTLFAGMKTMFSGVASMFRGIADRVLVRRNLVTECLGRVLLGENLVPGGRRRCSLELKVCSGRSRLGL